MLKRYAPRLTNLDACAVETVVSRIGERFHFDPLGSHKLKGHSPVNVWGIRTARTAPVVAAEAEVQQ